MAYNPQAHAEEVRKRYLQRKYNEERINIGKKSYQAYLKAAGIKYQRVSYGKL